MLVIKVGGSEGIQHELVCAELAALWRAGQRLVVVHGGSAETNRVATALGRPPRFVTSASGYESRYTDRETLEIFAMVYCGKVNKLLVEQLQQLEVNAVGLSGLDGRMLVGRRKEAIKVVEDGKKKVLRGDYTGRVEQVNRELLTLLLGAGFLPVVAPLAASYAGEAINVDGDRAAAHIARAFQADKLIILSNVPGLLRDLSDPSSLVQQLGRDEVEEASAWAQGRMKKKLLGACEALDGGVSEVILASGSVSNPITAALHGGGTHIRASRSRTASAAP